MGQSRPLFWLYSFLSHPNPNYKYINWAIYIELKCCAWDSNQGTHDSAKLKRPAFTSKCLPGLMAPLMARWLNNFTCQAIWRRDRFEFTNYRQDTNFVQSKPSILLIRATHNLRSWKERFEWCEGRRFSWNIFIQLLKEFSLQCF